MKPTRIVLLLAAVIFAATGWGPGAPSAAVAQAQDSQAPPTLASTLDREISAVEKQIVEVAETMPEDKYNFSPENLNIPGADFKGVRSFAVQVKHVASSNYFIWSPLTGDKVPENIKDGNGPADVKTKADIIKFLKDSFSLGHKAAATLTAENMLQPPGHSKSSRLRLAMFGCEHAFDHYGQMVEYLRMNGIVPPASVLGTSLPTHSQTQSQPPLPARSRSEEMLDRWNDIGKKLVAMAQDFPEDKYDYKLQKDERTFAQNLLHAAALDFVLIRWISGSNLGPDFGEGDNPSRDAFKTKADVVKFVQEAIADGAQVIQQQGDAGLDKTTKFGKRLSHNSNLWTFAIEHSGEHYGQLVVYYRANNMVPPDSRR